MRKRFGKAILLLPLLASFGLTAGEIKGIVRDETNAPVEGAVVSATSTALPKGATTATEADGRYRIPNVPAGDYTVVAKFGGSTTEATVTVAADGTAPEVALKVSMEQAMAQATTYEITGTRIRTVNQTAVSPVATIGQTEIRNQGSTRIEDVVNSLPQAFTAQGAGISNGSNGTANVNLRGLGSARSLVLIDGRRLGPGNPNSGGAVFGDLNFIPSSLVERVDVLTGGASAVYGADAVAGVVNFIMKKDFQGVQLDVDWGMYQHGQHSAEGQAAINEALAAGLPATQFIIPGDKWNLMYPSVSLTLGASTKDGKGNVTAYASYRHDEPILQGERDFSACTFFSGDTFSCGGSGTSSPALKGTCKDAE